MSQAERSRAFRYGLLVQAIESARSNAAVAANRCFDLLSKSDQKLLESVVETLHGLEQRLWSKKP